MRRLTVFGLVAVLLMAWTWDADARRRRRRRRRAPKTVVNKRSAAAITAMLGKFRFNMSPRKVMKMVTTRIKNRYYKQIRKARSEPLKQDRLRRELASALAKVKNSYTKFNGQRTNWDSSIVDDQFSHNNSESLLVTIDKKQNRFFFFHNDQLYKLFIAFNADHPQYKGLTFPRFLALLIKTFGQGTPSFQKDVAGQSRLHHVEWKGTGNTAMWAVDKTTLYGNFCLVVYNSQMDTRVREGRKLNSPSRRPSIDPLIDSVIKPQKEEQ